ncbi:hypothetical protein [Dyadobacter arcticus]|uniref:Uncharacterized protein n=1 Tax=Dyadobacter arcticus TaxID=1078754 RepID=A0ABX0UM63_9BACT|nr:hypothetical protein [Dyadobacter arcticus]NIJ54007.1 hypothetical protein [Dyadobacter arcticus]
MHTLRNCLLLMLVGVNFLNCSSGESLLTINEIFGYSKDAKDHIIFLNFKITELGPGKNERVRLVKAASGAGRTKNLNAPVHSPHYIEVVPRYKTGRIEVGMAFEHPLYRSVEVPGHDGTIIKQSVIAKEGILHVRFQEDRNMDRIELYSITPDRGSVKIYTLNLKP